MNIPSSIGEIHTRKQKIDTFLASAKLNEDELEAMMKDINGVKDNPNKIKVWTSLYELEAELKDLKADTAYGRAVTLDISYCTNRDFQLAFLRKRHYDAKAAAKQMIEFFELKEQLFGSEKLVKDIKLSDLDEEAIECIRDGSLQVLSSKDSAGRQILANFPVCRAPREKQSELRARYYVIMSLLESPETRADGATTIYFGCHPCDLSAHSRQISSQAYMVFQVLPIHWATVHFCGANYLIYSIVGSATFVFPEKYRARMQNHYGDPFECEESLVQHGFPPHFLPLAPQDGSVVMDDHLNWLNSRIQEELTRADGTSTEADDFIQEPLPHDVLFGKGRSKCYGNIMLRKIQDELQEDYEKADKQRKVVLSDIILSKLKDAGARFIKFDEDSQRWREVSYKEAHEKIAHGFRNRKRYKS